MAVRRNRMILLDVSHTSHSAAHTGIQRVARRLWRELGPEAEPICYDPYGRSWRPLEGWERSNLAGGAAGGKRGAHWPWTAKAKGFLGRIAGRAGPAPRLRSGQAVAPYPASFFCPEIFSPEVARAHPSLFRAISGPRAASFHDAIALKFPELTPPKVVARFPSYLQDLLRFDGIAADSDESKDALVDYWRWLGVRNMPVVTTIPLAADLPGGGDGRAKASPPRPIVLCVSSIEGRKNHLALLEACESLWKRGLAFDLHLIGLPRPETAGEALRRIGQLRLAGRPIRCDGAVTDEAVEAAYARASFTVYPSLMEGSGLPVRESLAHGLPCVCAGFGALGEVAFGGGCIPLAALDSAAIAAAIEDLVLNPAKLDALSAAARSRPVRTWKDFARDIADWLGTLKKFGF